MSDVMESLHLSTELQTRAAHFAAIEGVSLEHWVLEAVTNKVKTAEFFYARAQRASGKSLTELLGSGCDNPPIPGDELPEGWGLR